MIAFYIIAALFIIWLAVLIIRAALCKKKSEEKASPAEKIEVDETEATEHLSKMIQCKTVSDKDKSKVDEKEFEKFRALLREFYPTVHEKCERTEIAGGLLYRIKGKTNGKVSVFMSHFDVVSVNEESWSVDPFAGISKDGFLWGRGALDTKCTLLAIMESAEALLKKGFVPENDIYLSFGCNEEIAGDCAPSIVKYLKDKGIHPAFVLDEGGMIYKLGFSVFPYDLAAIGICEKGPMDVELTVKGQSGHASRPPKHTAAGLLARDISRIENRQFPMKIGYPVKAMVNTIAPYTPFYMRLILANLWCFSPLLKFICKKNNTAAAFLRTTMAFTQLSASKGANVLPTEAKAVANVRLAKGVSSEDAVEHMKKASRDKNLEIRIVNVSEATQQAQTSGKYWNAMKNAIENSFENTVVAPYLMIGGTDSRFFDEIADNIYKFAPVLSGGLLSTIHSDDERIPLENIPKLIRFFYEVMMNM
ncbi:MAG: M20/M25/M40 family metallo-hydrolase [Acutalibacteraceae bacterium]